MSGPYCSQLAGVESAEDKLVTSVCLEDSESSERWCSRYREPSSKLKVPSAPSRSMASPGTKLILLSSNYGTLLEPKGQTGSRSPDDLHLPKDLIRIGKAAKVNRRTGAGRGAGSPPLWIGILAITTGSIHPHNRALFRTRNYGLW